MGSAAVILVVLLQLLAVFEFGRARSVLNKFSTLKGDEAPADDSLEQARPLPERLFIVRPPPPPPKQQQDSSSEDALLDPFDPTMSRRVRVRVQVHKTGTRDESHSSKADPRDEDEYADDPFEGVTAWPLSEQ